VKNNLSVKASLSEKIEHYTNLLNKLREEYAKELTEFKLIDEKPKKVNKGWKKYLNNEVEDKRLTTYSTQSKNLQANEIPKINFANF